MHPVLVSVIVPEMLTGTIFPFGGHKDLGVAENVIIGGAVHNGVLFRSTLTEPVAQPLGSH